MNGVVLWSDATQHKAVIWCEDQGDLAFYSQNQCQTEISLHEGDWVCFDLAIERNRRLAENPRVLTVAACSGLAQCLTAAQPEIATSKSERQDGAKVIPFAAPTNKYRCEIVPRRNRLG